LSPSGINLSAYLQTACKREEKVGPFEIRPYRILSKCPATAVGIEIKPLPFFGQFDATLGLTWRSLRNGYGILVEQTNICGIDDESRTYVD
jgi:hypothetical protein